MKQQAKQVGKWILGFVIVGILLGCDLSASPGGPITPKTYSPKEWVEADEYTVIIHDVIEEVVVDTDDSEQQVIYLHVEYHNQSNAPLDYRLGQWSIFDDENYAYDNEIYNIYYEDQGKPRLRESTLNPGMQVKGWIAFPIPDDVTISRAQFLTGYLDGTAVDFVIKLNSE